MPGHTSRQRGRRWPRRRTRGVFLRGRGLVRRFEFSKCLGNERRTSGFHIAVESHEIVSHPLSTLFPPKPRPMLTRAVPAIQRPLFALLVVGQAPILTALNSRLAGIV